MTWNYRVIKMDEGKFGTYYAIHEVYYDGAGEITHYSNRPTDIAGESIQDINGTIMLIRAATKKPILCEMELKKHFRKLKREEAKTPVFKL